MRLLHSTDLALRLLMHLAMEAPDRHHRVETLAGALGGLSRNHLHKIVQDLAALGMVRTLRGVNGGVILAVQPDEIRVGTLIRQLEGDQPIVECFRPDGGCCTLRPGCGLRGLLQASKQNLYRELDRHSLADCLPTVAAPEPATPDREALTPG
jgi:Rrf2 family nitric oxide-sensitive transcriptional repressor